MQHRPGGRQAAAGAWYAAGNMQEKKTGDKSLGLILRLFCADLSDILDFLAFFPDLFYCI